MARAATSFGARLRRLNEAQKRTKALPVSQRLSSKPMSELIGVNWPVLRDWCDEIEGFEASGAFVRGGNGIEWEFNPRKTVAYLVKHFQTRITAQAKKSRAISKAVGVTLSNDDAPTLAETKDLVNLTLTVTAAQERMGGYTPTQDVADFIAGYNDELVSGILGVKTEVDPNGNLPPAVRKSMDEALRRLATRLHGRAQKYVEVKRAGLQQGGTG